MAERLPVFVSLLSLRGGGETILSPPRLRPGGGQPKSPVLAFGIIWYHYLFQRGQVVPRSVESEVSQFRPQW